MNKNPETQSECHSCTKVRLNGIKVGFGVALIGVWLWLVLGLAEGVGLGLGLELGLV